MKRNGSATAYQQYQQVRVLSSTREGLVPLLYERLLGHLRRADVQIEHDDLAGKAESLGSASEIVFELLASLDFDDGGEIAARLAALYGFFSREIMEIGRTLDRERLGRMTGMVESLHEAWARAIAEFQAEAPSAADSNDGPGPATGGPGRQA